MYLFISFQSNLQITDSVDQSSLLSKSHKIAFRKKKEILSYNLKRGHDAISDAISDAPLPNRSRNRKAAKQHGRDTFRVGNLGGYLTLDFIRLHLFSTLFSSWAARFLEANPRELDVRRARRLQSKKKAKENERHIERER